MRIGTRIALSYFVVVTIAMLVSFAWFWQWLWNSAQNQINEALVQTLVAVQVDYERTLENANNYSRMVFSDANLQSLLRQGSIYADLQKQSQVSNHLYNLTQAVPLIHSVFIFDTEGGVYSEGKQPPPAFLLDTVEDAPWYDEVVAGRGSNIFRLNAGGVFKRDAGDDNYVSLIRQIRDLDNTAPLGILVLNIPESAIAMTFEDAIDNPQTNVYILDTDNSPITPKASENNLTDEEFRNLLNELESRASARNDSGYFIWESSGGVKYLVSFLAENQYGSKFLGLTSYNAIYYDMTPTLLIVLSVLLLNGFLFLFASIIISRNVTSPVRRLLEAMKNSGKGQFEIISAKSKLLEFQQLYGGYNDLMTRVQNLVQNVLDEQTAYRKAELHALQVQIKPHFLYNTLDSILSLNLSGRIDEACRLLEALGSYYRNSVNKGGEVITIGREIEMVANYMIIQNIRYQDLVRMEYDIDPASLELPMLKMVLQPLVENALYHGIRPKGGPGTIRISARCEEKHIALTVQDDGLGMTKEHLESLLGLPEPGKENSFGLWGTLERVRMFYGYEECYEIRSNPGEGTIITLYLPRER